MEFWKNNKLLVTCFLLHYFSFNCIFVGAVVRIDLNDVGELNICFVQFDAKEQYVIAVFFLQSCYFLLNNPYDSA